MNNLKFKNKIIGCIVLLMLLSFARDVFSLDINLIDPKQENDSIDLLITPHEGTFLGGSRFDVGFFIDTKGKKVTEIVLDVSFDPSRMSIVRPSSGKSVISVWPSEPVYDNDKGVARFAGSIPEGIISSSGLVTNITFEAKSLGQAEVVVLPTSKIVFLDGISKNAVIKSNRGNFNIFPRPYGGVSVYSESHPLEDKWYNNSNIILSWDRIPDILGYSFVLDNKPNTLPSNNTESIDTIKQYENVSDGVWYFHIKSLRKGNVWGSTTNRKIKIDTLPPVFGKLQTKYFSDGGSSAVIVDFSATDNASGIDHYEVAITDTLNKNSISPAFFTAESPYKVSMDVRKEAVFIVRAIDKAGNIADTNINIKKLSLLGQFFANNKIFVLGFIIFVLIAFYIMHFFRDHKVFKVIGLVGKLMKAESKKLEIKEQAEIAEEEKIVDEVAEKEIKQETPVALLPESHTPANHTKTINFEDMPR